MSVTPPSVPALSTAAQEGASSPTSSDTAPSDLSSASATQVATPDAARFGPVEAEALAAALSSGSGTTIANAVRLGVGEEIDEGFSAEIASLDLRIDGAAVVSRRERRAQRAVLQGKRHDPSGAYVRRWVPELRDVPDKWVHEPWAAPGGVPAGYPERIVDHAEERAEALRRYAAR